MQSLTEPHGSASSLEKITGTALESRSVARLAIVTDNSELARPDLQLTPVAVPARRDTHAPSVYLASLSKTSQRTMRTALNTIAKMVSDDLCDADTLPWERLRFQHTAAIRARLSETYKPERARLMLSALKGVLKAAWRLDDGTHFPTEAYQRAVDLDPIRGESLTKGRHVPDGELGAVFLSCAQDPSPMGARDAAIVAIGSGVGLRRSEIVALDLSDYDQETGEIRVRIGKGRKGRVTFAGANVREAIAWWLEVRGDVEGPLFLPVRAGRSNKGGATRPIEMRRLTAQTVADILQRREEQSGIKHVAPHDLRRTFIGNQSADGVDILTLAKAVGHADPKTTMKYRKNTSRAIQDAAEKVRLPFVRGPQQMRLPIEKLPAATPKSKRAR